MNPLAAKRAVQTTVTDAAQDNNMTETESPPSLSLVSHIDALPTGTRLAEFEIVDLLGVGGFGMVYKAFDHSLQRLVAIKEYMPSALAGRSRGMTVSMKSTADALTFMAGLKSFVAEARLLAQFDHPSLVKVFRFWEANNTAYMVMPLYSGVTLKQARNHMRCPPPEAWLRKVLWSVLGALNVLHEGKTMHRDVSPDNIFLQDVGPPVLLDLGAARRAISDKSQKHTAILKVNYAPIEQYADAEDMRQGPWTDLYSLAAVVHGCLCNEPPVPATFRVLKDRLPPFAKVAATVKEQFGLDYSDSFVQAITHALGIRPEERPQSTESFAAEMGLVAPGGMSRFDWRAELGDIWLPDSTQPEEVRALLTTTPTSDAPTQLFAGTVAAGAAGREGLPGLAPEIELPDDEAPPVATTAPMNRAGTMAAAVPALPQAAPQAEPPAGPSANMPSPRPAPAVPTQPMPVPAETAAAPSRSRAGLVVAGVALAAALGVGGWWATSGSRPSPELPAAAAAASEPVPAVAASAPASAADPKEEIIVSTPAVPAATVSAPVPPKPAQVASAPNRRASSPVAPAATLAASAPARPVESRPAMAEAPVQVPASPPTRPQRPARAEEHARPGPAELCADASFLSRPMCLFRECEKPEFSNLALCVEQRKRFQNARTPDSQ